jgi:hypothetical protein
MKELWQLLLPGMNVPACGVADEAAPDGDTAAEPVQANAPELALRLNRFSIFSRTLLKIRR